MTAQDKGQIVEVGALEAMIRTEIDVAITTARAYPRDMKESKAKLLSLATADRATAESCFYAVPRGGKPIRGPSIRLAEILAAAYRNIRAAVRIIDITQQHVVAQAICHDLENNVMIGQEVRRSIVDKKGRRYSPDMITVTSQAACSIAFRNAIFKVIPFGLFKAEIEIIEKVGLGEERDLQESRAAMLAWFEGQGIASSRVLAMFGKATVEDIDLEDIGLLRGLCNAIQTEETTAEEAFKDFGEEPSSAMKALKEKLDEKKGRGKPKKKDTENACESWLKVYAILNNGVKDADRVHNAFKDAIEGHPIMFEGVKSLNDVGKTNEIKAKIVLQFLELEEDKHG